jgi:hypothetical protein
VVALALISVAVLALLVALLFGALLEMYRDIRQLRDAVGILDRPLAVDLGAVAGTRPSAYGLPSALDSAAAAVVLFLSDRCETCRVLATGLQRPLPPGLWVVLEASTSTSAADFLQTHGLSATLADGRIILDVARDIAGRLGLDTTPVGIRLQDGVLTAATTVPSSRYLQSILPEPLRLRRAG